MSVVLSPVGGVAAQFFTNSGAVLTGGKIYTYAAGTSTPEPTYTTASGTIAHTNPIVLDAAGRVPDSGEIWLTDGVAYKFVLKTSADVLIATYDNISGINSNFVNFTNDQEIQTATAGQTVFTLTTMAYLPGTNSLSVFVDGVNQYGPGASYAYEETNNTTVTFNSGLHVGAEVKFSTTQLQGAGAIDASQVAYDPPFTGSVATNVEAKLAQTVSVKDFGAVGDGITDDTVAIQAALNSGAKIVQGLPGDVYVVNHTGTVTVNTAAQRYCILVPTGVIFDLKGCTIKAHDSSNSSPLMFYSVTDSGVVNGVIDCNKANQSTPATGEIAGVYAYGCTQLILDGLTVKNARMYAGRLLGNTGGRRVNLWCTDSDGDGWSFGITGTSGELRDFYAFIDNVYAENCTGVYGGGFQGNPQIFTVMACNVGKVEGKNCGGGIKIQDLSANSNFGELIFTGPTNGSTNSGIKIQGNTSAAVYPKDIKIGLITALNCYGNGLRVTEVESVQIGSYSGRGNGQGAGASGSDQYDGYIGTTVSAGAKSVQVSEFFSDSPTKVGLNLFGIGSNWFGSIVVRNATGSAVLNSQSDGRFDCNRILAIDDSATMTYAFRVSGPIVGNVDQVETTALHSTSQSRLTIATANYQFNIGKVRLGSTDVLEGVIKLTNGATSTSVTCGHIWMDYVGGTSDYFQPIIVFEPMRSSTRLLGSMYAIPTVGSVGTGFSINHALAGANDYVFWRLLGWKTGSVSPA